MRAVPAFNPAELGVSYGAVSRHIELLEEWLGPALFRHPGHGVALTGESRALLADSQSALERIARAAAYTGKPSNRRQYIR